MTDRYERQIEQLRNDISRLTDESDECRRAAERIRADFGKKPLLRDRNRFFHSLLNGDEDTFARVHPRWRGYVRKAREASRLRRELAGRKTRLAAVRRRAAVNSPGYRALSAKVKQAKEARCSCRSLLRSISRADNQLDRATKNPPRDKASRSRVDREVREVAERLRAVREQARVVNQKVAPYGALDLRGIDALDTEFPGSGGDHTVRLKMYKAAKAPLKSLRASAKSLLRDIAAREKSAREQRDRYLKDER